MTIRRLIVAASLTKTNTDRHTAVILLNEKIQLYARDRGPLPAPPTNASTLSPERDALQGGAGAIASNIKT
jgi:hypothetical protein